ncbi:hypothetical protein BJ741DRAFT_715103 [Chytriomyces cf. hyalinus JEL632]|nr:hypothetical protein BJ741DRAFT_715103 [Chytriomyces cf. hyalinus JEL632]
MRYASKALSAKWQNLSEEQRAVYEAKANKANAEPLQLVHQLDCDKKLELCRKSLLQLGKIHEVLEALGWSYMVVAINEETHATFKEIKGTSAVLADFEYHQSNKDLEIQLKSSLRLAKSYPDVAKLVGTNKSVQQSRMERLALLSLNECLAGEGFKTFSTFPWSQVQSKRLLDRSFHFVNWPAHVPMKRNMTIKHCEMIIRMFERRYIQGSIGSQHESRETGESRAISDTFFDIENAPSRSTMGAEAGFGEMTFLDFLNNSAI